MQARRASRELALILFSQLEKNIEKYKKDDFQDMIVKSVRTLISSATSDISLNISELGEIQNKIIEFENNHPDNLSRPIDVENIPVKIPLTNEFNSKLDKMLKAMENTLNALDIAELSVLSTKDDVRQYVNKIASEFQKNKNEIDKMIGECALGWDIQRIFKIDKDILRIAIIELIYIKDAPPKVVIDEALELAKKYSTDDSPTFINGILARIIERHLNV